MQQQHLKLHDLEHAQRVKEAQRERLASEYQRQNRHAKQPNMAMHKMGELLVELGEHLQDNAYNKKQPAR